MRSGHVDASVSNGRMHGNGDVLDRVCSPKAHIKKYRGILSCRPQRTYVQSYQAQAPHISLFVFLFIKNAFHIFQQRLDVLTICP